MDDAHRRQAGGRIDAAQVRYIKLGEGGAFARECIDAGELGISFANIPHDLCQRGDWDAVQKALIAQGRSQGATTRQTGEIRDFYELDAEALWITFAEGLLWWGFAAPGVAWRDDLVGRLPRRRLVMGGWRSEDIAGAPLRTRHLSTRLTCIAGYRGTVCKVAEAEYLLRRINGEIEPLVREGETALQTLHDLAARLIQRLHDKEFEVLVDLIFQASGWRRISVLGETEQDIDLLIEQIATGERAFVQVKSRATPAVFNDYVGRFRAYEGCARMFFVCHSPSTALRATSPPEGVDLWGIETIAGKALRAGLFDWLIERVRSIIPVAAQQTEPALVLIGWAWLHSMACNIDAGWSGIGWNWTLAWVLGRKILRLSIHFSGMQTGGDRNLTRHWSLAATNNAGTASAAARYRRIAVLKKLSIASATCSGASM